jgi:AraC-like DNA-binding protein
MASDGTAMSRDENRENSDACSIDGRLLTPLPSPSRRTINDCRAPENAMMISSPAMQLRASCCEELARLANIARDLRCSAVIRGPDATLMSLTPPNGAAGEDSRDGRKALSVPIYDAEGAPFARIELSSEELHQSSFAQKLLQAVVEPLARSLGERLFRIRYCPHCILAAQRADDSRSCLLLAIDHDGHLVGADHFARQILKEPAMNLKGLGLSRLFQVRSEDLHRARYHEVSLRLIATGDGAPWFVLITPPDLRAVGSDNRTQLHSRPRLESIASSSASPANRSESFGLPTRIVQRIGEFVDARLESGIDVGELASRMGYSPAHFSRMFKRSFGITPHTYVMRRRLTLARELIARTELALAEVALKAGFSDQSHLCRSFRQFFGLSPRAFRMHHGGNDEGVPSLRCSGRRNNRAAVVISKTDGGRRSSFSYYQ